MTNFAPVAPIQLLKKLKQDAGHYHLVLAHEVSEKSMAHREFWDTDEHFNDLVILDNSVIELGYAMPVGTMSALKGVLPFATFMVLPDVIGDSQATLDTVAGTLSSAKFTGSEGFIGVVQGQTYDELLACAYAMYQKYDLRFLAIPRHVTMRIGSRKHITKAVLALGKDVQVHLLGFSDDIEDDLMTAKIKGVIGIDSAVPIWNPGELTTQGPVGRRPESYLNWDALPKTAVNNVRRVRSWLNDVMDVRMLVEHAGQGEISQVRS